MASHDRRNSYRVEILNGANSVRSDFITATDWSPNFDLERGRVYSWSVTAYKDGQPLSAIAGSGAAARFGIVSEEDERILAEALARSPESHLMLAAAYLAAGLIEDSERELNLADPSQSDPSAWSFERESPRSVRRSGSKIGPFPDQSISSEGTACNAFPG